MTWPDDNSKKETSLDSPDDQDIDRQMREIESSMQRSQQAVHNAIDSIFGSINTTINGSSDTVGKVVDWSRTGLDKINKELDKFEEKFNTIEDTSEADSNFTPCFNHSKSPFTFNDDHDHDHDHDKRRFPFFKKRFRNIVREGNKNGILWAYPVPSEKWYNNCKELNGTGLWDRSGVWRCLFPNSNSNSNSNLNINEKDQYGKFLFPNYEELLDWKYTMKKLSKSQQLQSKSLTQSQSEISKQINEHEHEHTTFKSWGSSTIITSEFLNDGTEKIKEIKKEYYPDGTSKTFENIKTKPPTTNNSNSNSNSNNLLDYNYNFDNENINNKGNNDGNDKGSNGWFWK